MTKFKNRNANGRMPEEGRNRKCLPPVILTMVLIAVLCLTIGAACKKNESRKTVQEENSTQEAGQKTEKWQEGTISYNGRHYLYNKNIKTYLIMGIDSDEPAKASTNYIKGGQSDAMFLLVTDASDKTISVISINRNTMTRIKTCYETGADAGYKTAQICIQHGYGDGMNLSCSRVAESVSHLFYNLPIHGYLSLRMGAIPMMNDAVGGVELTILQDIKNSQKNVELKAGETLTLSGDEAYAYLRTRDINEFESATDRLRRQEQYITAYMSKLKTAAGNNPAAAVKIYESIEEYAVSSIDFASLAAELKDYEYSQEHLYTIPGETVMGETYEEFYVDEEAFYEMILDVFYLETE